MSLALGKHCNDLYSSLKVRDDVSYPYRTTVNITREGDMTVTVTEPNNNKQFQKFIHLISLQTF
jgi:hypothetical protein